MNLLIRLALVAVAACLCLSEGAPDNRLLRSKQRPTRGFKTLEMMTARGFGKRDRPSTRTEHEDMFTQGQRRLPVALLLAQSNGKRDSDAADNPGDNEYLSKRGFKPNANVLVARGYGKRDKEEVFGEENFLDTLESSPQKDRADSDEKPFESVPVEWFVNEMLNNQEFARSVVRKFIDVNQDGMLSNEELLRNPA